MPQVEVGRLVRLGAWTSRHVDARPVDVWLPPGFVPGQRCSLLLMHDGQMLFDARTTWNRQAWNAHTAVHALMQAGVIGPTVVVGIWNNGPQRYAEYFPQKALDFAPAAARQDYLSREGNGRLRADAYLRFIVEELLPALQAQWGIRAERARTMVAGASMGGLISLYALCEYPQVFGSAGALSTHWVAVAPSRSEEDKRNEALSLAFLDYLEQRLPPPGHHRLWVDRGDDALDSLYAAGLERFGALLARRGYTDRDAVARTITGTGHNEVDWSRRIADVVKFLASRG